MKGSLRVKPFPRPKIERLGRPKYMTLVAGFKCKDGLLVCADMEESFGATSKRQTGKMSRIDLWGECHVVVGGAGSSAAADLAAWRIWKGLGILKSGQEKPNEDHVLEVVSESLKTVHEKYIWPDLKHDHSISLVVGMMHGTDASLWATHDLIPRPENFYACVGSGADIATYFADRLHDYCSNEQELVRIATFIFKEAKEAGYGVGLGTEMWMLRKNGTPHHYSCSDVKQIEGSIPSFEATLDRFRETLIKFPEAGT